MKQQTRTILIMLAAAASVYAQVLTLVPSCGKIGAKVCITGSGWAEPNPVCRYTFKFDGTTVAPDQQDGLYGPPSTNFSVPVKPPGDYTVHVELRLNSPDNLLQQKDQTFKVVANIANPYNPAPADTYGGIASFLATFDPNNVCDASPCKNIRFVQAVQPTGRLKADHTMTRKLGYAERNFPPGKPAIQAIYDADLTAAGWKVDVLANNMDPYYQYPRPGGALSGNTNPNVPATMGDKPNMLPSNYPADIDQIILTFEVAVICVDGDLKGRYLGTLRWTWVQDKGGVATVTHGTPDRNQPSQNLLDAVTKWNTNHAYANKFPQSSVQSCQYN